MKFKEYQEHTTRTLPDLDRIYFKSPQDMPLERHALDFIHMRLGMTSELSELALALLKRDENNLPDKVNIGEELTDILWYLSNDLNLCKKIGFITPEEYTKFNNIEFGNPMVTDGGYALGENPPWFSSLVYNIAELTDLAKKALAYKKPVEAKLYIHHVGYLFGAINNIAHANEINLEEFMEKNIAKLRKRFPEKFDMEKAINRDHAEERKVLES